MAVIAETCVAVTAIAAGSHAIGLIATAAMAVCGLCLVAAEIASTAGTAR